MSDVNTQTTQDTEAQNLGLDPNASLQEILNFDPFADKDKKPEGTDAKPADVNKVDPKTPMPVVAKAKEPIPTTSATVTQDPAAPPATPPAPDPLAGVVQQQTDLIRSMVENANKTPSKEGDTKPQPKFSMQIPPQLMEAIQSDDPKMVNAGMNALVNGVANTVWDAVNTHINEYVMNGIQQHVTQYYQGIQQQKQVFDDFYGAFPQLNNPALMPIVQQMAMQMSEQEMKTTGKFVWNQGFRDKVGQAMLALLTQAGGGQQSAPTPAPKPKTFQAGSGAARPTPGPTNDFMDQIGLA